MTTSQHFTWNKKQKRWYTKYRGKQHGYTPKTKSKEGSLAEVREWWERRLAEVLEKEQRVSVADRRFLPEYEQHIIPLWQDALRQAVEIAEMTGHPDNQNDVRFCSNVLRRLSGWVDDEGRTLPNPKAAGFDFHLYETAEEDLTEAHQRLRESDEFWGEPATLAESSKSIGGSIRDFLAEQVERAQHRAISTGRYGVLKAGLKHFGESIGSEKPLDEITADRLARYHRENLAEVAGKKVAERTAGDRLATVKFFLRWCYERGRIDALPRNMQANSRSLTIKKRLKKVEVLPADHIAACFGGANDRTKLYLLLMLNCGMYPKDISDLRQSEVRWKEGRIIRKRSTTHDAENVPEVEWKLWPETARLLRANRSGDAERVLINENGFPLCVGGIKDDGNTKRSDAVKNAYWRLCKKLGLEPLPLKRFRKTSSSKLAEHREYGRYAQYFLGQAPQNVADQFYIKPSQALFDEAVDWLAEQFGFAAKPTRKPK